MYQKWMGLVDRLDKNVSLSRIRLKRCIKRYHRAVFMWYLAAVLNNILVLFDLMLVDVDKLKKSKARLGYKHWFQNTLGNVLMLRGLRLAEDSWIHRASKIVTKFMRHAVKILLKKRLTTPPTVTRRVALRPRVNTSGRGRPRKRKHAGGRPPNNQVFCLLLLTAFMHARRSACTYYNHTVTRQQTTSVLHDG